MGSFALPKPGRKINLVNSPSIARHSGLIHAFREVVLLRSLFHLLSREDILSIFFPEGRRVPDSIGQSILLSPVLLLPGCRRQCLSFKDHFSYMDDPGD